MHTAARCYAPVSHHPVQCELSRLQNEAFAASRHGLDAGIKPKRNWRRCLLSFGNCFGEARAPFKETLRQAVAQPNERDLAQMHPGIRCIDRLSGSPTNDLLVWSRIEKLFQ
jgi:hypothetical protein